MNKMLKRISRAQQLFVRGKSGGFTLIELLVVIAIIGILSTVIVASLSAARETAHINRMLSDMRQISTAWQIWQIDTGASFPNERLFCAGGVCTNPQWTCHDDPAISQTDLATNVLGLPGWNGPYINTDWPTDPFGKVYGYDNDSDVYVPGSPSTAYNGVNVFVGWCEWEGNKAKYLEFAQKLDQKVDGGDGRLHGRVRWDTRADGRGQMSFLISETP